MKAPNYGDESPIAAFATSYGNSALTLIRCSGKDSIRLISSVFSSSKLNDAPGNTVVHGWITAGNEKIDEVLVSVFRAPKSYTGEDSLDICCHGGISTGKAVMDVLKNAGFRDALPGEFTFRAFMNGKIDLTKSESVMEIVSAKTDKGRQHAVSRLLGSLEKEINEIKTLLVQVLAGAEIYLDYSEDEISAEFDASASDEIAGRLPGKEIAQEVLARIKKLSNSWKLERIYQEGVMVVIAGCPNAGKSSLFNMLLKEERSIVTEVPGTTRDWIEAFVSIDGIPIRLIDTAGLREASDSVEKIGVERSRKMLQDADIVLYLIDGEQGITNEDKDFLALHSGSGENHATYGVPSPAGTLPKTGSCYLFVWNKADITPAPEGYIAVSAKTGEGLQELYSAITSAITSAVSVSGEVPSVTHGGVSLGSASLGTERQKKLIDSASYVLEEALILAEREEPLDIIAPLIREAVSSLGEITGEVSTADILEEMFSRFCVGK